MFDFLRRRPFFRHRAQSRISTGTLAPGAPLSEAFDVLVLLAAELAAVTEEDLERTERDLKPIGGGETRVGVIHRIEVRRACALLEVLQGRAEKANWECNYVAISGNDKLRFAEESNRLQRLADCIQEIFWVQAMQDVGFWPSEEGQLVVRKNWEIVSRFGASHSLSPEMMRPPL